MFLKDKKISYKINLVVIIITFLFMLINGIYSYIITRKNELDKVDQQVSILSKRLVNNLAQPLWNLEIERIKNIIIPEMDYNYILGITIEEKENITYCIIKDTNIKDKNKNFKTIDISDNKEGIDAFLKDQKSAKEFPIEFNNSSVGILRIYLTDYFINIELLSLLIRTINQSVVMTILLVILLSISINKLVISQIKIITENFKVISTGKGDLTKQIMIRSRDEIGMLATYFNDFMLTLQSMIKSIKDSFENHKSNNDKVSTMTDDSVKLVSLISSKIFEGRNQFEFLNSNILNSSSAIEEILRNITSLAKQIMEQSSAVIESSSSIQEMATSIKNIDNSVNEKQKLTNVVFDITNEGNKKLKETNQIVADITNNIGNISEVMQIISNIASQTNLLAMNAAIEAAHAGEEGKGFSVVADEIRKLAEDSANNSKDISDLLKIIINKIQNLQQSSNDTEKAFEEIRNGVTQIMNIFSEVSNAMTEMAAGSSNILTAISSLNNITSEVDNGAKDMQQGATTINDSMQKIKQISTVIMQFMNEIDKNGKEINDTMDSVKKLNVDNISNIENLNELINKFKIS